MKKIVFDIIDSTQTYVKDHLDELEELEFVCANNQTEGRGRTGNKWISNKENLMFSFYFVPRNIEVNDYSKLTLLVGLALRNTLAIITQNNQIEIKWPNDIIYNHKKIAGIIAEGIFKKENYIVIGIGVNVNQTVFDYEIKDKASSLKLISKNEIIKDNILELFEKEFSALLLVFKNNINEIMNNINQFNYLKDKEIEVKHPSYSGLFFKVLKIDENGCLLVKDDKENLLCLNANEITLHNTY